MTENEKIDQLNNLVDVLFGPVQRNVLATYSAPFDISRPNIHDNKGEFLRELKAVQTAIGHLNGLWDLLVVVPTLKGGDPLQNAMVDRLRRAIESDALQRSKSKPTKSASDLALKNLNDTGFFYNSLYVIIDLLNSFNQRLRDLREQEVQFWTVANRPPNYYARVIALRFARLFASRTGKRPTFGISSEGAHPSTEFGRALEEVFGILEIKANVRKAAEWAISQLTENDWNPVGNALERPLRGVPAFDKLRVNHPSSRDEIVRLLQDKG